jgi:uncharacterized protein
MSMPATSNPPLAPVEPKGRIQALDVIRGLAILGILAVNADGFAAPMMGALHPPSWPFPNVGWTALSYWIMETGFHEKFITLFSMLFGVSVFLVGGERTDKAKGRVLWRRLAVLFALAMIHGFGIWWGDILSLYAVTGMIMLFCRSWGPRTLLIVGVALYLVMGFRHFDPAVLPFAPPAAHAEAAAELIPDPAEAGRKAMAAAETEEARSSWAGAYRVNTREYLRITSGYPYQIPSTLGLMMIGLSLFKSGFLAGRSSSRRYGLVLTAGAIALGVVAWLSWRSTMLETPVLGAHHLELLLTPLISLAYAAGLILLLRTRLKGALSPFAAAGRMAFTNYLSQSIIMTMIFYGGRGGLMGQVDRPALWAIVIAIWALQLIWSPLWLSRFTMGPFEWVWRCLTYGRRVPLLRPSAV